MIVAFQIILLVLICISALGVVGERKDEKLREIMVGMFLASLVSFIGSVLWL